MLFTKFKGNDKLHKTEDDVQMKINQNLQCQTSLVKTEKTVIQNNVTTSLLNQSIAYISEQFLNAPATKQKSLTAFYVFMKFEEEVSPLNRKKVKTPIILS